MIELRHVSTMSQSLVVFVLVASTVKDSIVKGADHFFTDQGMKLAFLVTVILQAVPTTCVMDKVANVHVAQARKVVRVTWMFDGIRCFCILLLYVHSMEEALEERGDGKRKLAIKAYGLFVELDPPLVPGLVFITHRPLLEWTGRCKYKGRQGKKAGQRDMRKKEKERKRERENKRTREREKRREERDNLCQVHLFSGQRP